MYVYIEKLLHILEMYGLKKCKLILCIINFFIKCIIVIIFNCTYAYAWSYTLVVVIIGENTNTNLYGTN